LKALVEKRSLEAALIRILDLKWLETDIF